ncbi:superoxide dismutase [Cu-Zn] [Lepeophtheirus salmonis]|nr:superoxide dismutase [Cu-Zn]-like [Lepeophtheirus salmonis]
MTSILFLGFSSVLLSFTITSGSTNPVNSTNSVSSANPRFLLMGLPGRDTPRARAEIFLNGDITRRLGTIHLQEVFGSVVFKGILFGLPPGFQTLTINEIPELGNNCRDAGPPYDPLEMNNAGYFTVKRHLGDLGSLLTEIFGTTLIHKIDPTITLSDVESNRFVVGRSIVVSVNMLDLQDDREGARIACGIIEPI